MSEAIRLVVEKNTFQNFEAAYEQCPLMPGMHHLIIYLPNRGKEVL